MAYKRLGEILTDAGVISEEQLGKALALGREQKKRLGEVLIDNKIITERQLIDVLKLQLGVDLLTLPKLIFLFRWHSFFLRTSRGSMRSCL